jgi:hypothetical protein
MKNDLGGARSAACARLLAQGTGGTSDGVGAALGQIERGKGRTPPGYCLRQIVPFDHWMRLSGRMTPSIFQGAPTLSVALLDNRH